MSSLNPSTTPDDVLRIEALNVATRIARELEQADAIVKRAEAFYAFLKGHSTEQDA